MDGNVKKVRQVKDFTISFSTPAWTYPGVSNKVNEWLIANEGNIEVIDFKITSGFNQYSSLYFITVLVDYYELQH